MNDFRILLDDPAEQPVLGFPDYALAFAGIIRESDPRFGIGIFGDWGSGKTTLMGAIQRLLSTDETIVTVWFNAWRYEREEHLIVPLLDTLREALVEWAKEEDRDPSLRDRAFKAASTVARAARAILVGLTVTARVPGLPGSPELAFDASKAIADWRQTPQEAAEQAQSFYHVSFRALQESLAQFVEQGRQRIVVFVDDLDRCLPLNALEVLESMKLFFDFQGFVFVVGLDQNAVEHAIEQKYRVDGGTSYGDAVVEAIRVSLRSGQGEADDRRAAVPIRQADAPIKGSEYIKKLFQVPFTLPPISAQQLDEFLGSLYSANMSDGQRGDLQDRVRLHLDYLITESGVNPREVKRYVNAYTLTIKSRPYLNPDVVLGLQTMAFRADWEDAYETLLAEREVFTDAVKRQLAGERSAVENLWPHLANLPDSVFTYLGSPAGKPLLEERSLDQYIHSVESTHSTQRGFAAAYRVLGKLRGILRKFESTRSAERRSELRGEFTKEAHSLRSALARSSGDLIGPALQSDIEELSQLPQVDPTAPDSEGELEAWRVSTEKLLARVQNRLRDMRRVTQVGASSA
jgi:KAP family P-loop domain